MSIITQNLDLNLFSVETAPRQFCIDFDGVWKDLGYSKKGVAKLALNRSELILGQDYTIELKELKVKRPQGGGRRGELILLTVAGFESFKSLNRIVKGDKQAGFIYVLKDKANNGIKVGFSAYMDKRLARHFGSNPFLKEIYRIPVSSMKSECLLHRSLKEHRIAKSKEWYWFNDESVGIIEEFANNIN